MFPFFRKPSRKVSNRRTPRRFRLESLELRNCPSAVGIAMEAQASTYPTVQLSGEVSNAPSGGCQVTLGGEVNATVSSDQYGSFTYVGPASGLGTITATATDKYGNPEQGSTTIMHTLPQMSGLSAVAEDDGTHVQIMGSVQAADTPANLPVTFSGSAGLLATSTATDANGNFSLVTTASSLGSVTAYVTDDWGAQSYPVTTQVMDNGPQIYNFTVMATGQGKQVEISGTVTGATAPGASVAISGPAVSGSAKADSNGNFNTLAIASQLGSVYAVATDAWGVASPRATTTFRVQPPYVSGLTATNLGNGYWQIQGTVSGVDVTDDSVQLSGVVSAGATPGANGTFSVVVQIAGNPSGEEYAVATDIWGQTSNQAQYMFYG